MQWWSIRRWDGQPNNKVYLEANSDQQALELMLKITCNFRKIIQHYPLQGDSGREFLIQDGYRFFVKAESPV